MNTLQRVCSMMLASTLLAACGSTSDEAAQSPPPVEDTVFGDMVGTMDKARGVEDTTMEHKQAIDRALEQDEGHSADESADQSVDR